MTQPNPVQTLASHIAQTDFEALSPEAVSKTKTFLLDTLGVGIAGASGAGVDNLLAAAQSWGQGDEAQVWNTGQRLPASTTAMVNAYLIHCQEFDCVHEDAIVHPMASVASAALARCQALSAAGRPVSGRTLMAALAVGVDVATLIGMAADGPVRFYRPATAGGFGAAAAVARIEGLDEDRIASALGIVYSQTSGTLQPHFEGSMLVGLQIGFNARAALTAVDLAMAGIEGPRDVLIGPYGYFHLYEQSQYSLGPAWSDLGTVWQITRLSQKPYPTGRLTHGAVDALARLMEEHGFTADAVARVTVEAPPLICRLVGRMEVMDPTTTYAKLSLNFVAATFLVRGRVDVPDFIGPERLGDLRVHQMAARIGLDQDENADMNAMTPQTVKVRLTDGREHAITLETVFGHPDVPLSKEQQHDKFARCCSYGRNPLNAAQVDRIIDMVDDLETLSDAADLVAATMP